MTHSLAFGGERHLTVLLGVVLLICSLAGSAAQLECGSGVCREKRCRLRIDGECRAQ
jgi:hypothetical protein